MALELCVGDVVWTKMKGYSWWPAKIGNPKKDAKKPNTRKIMHFVEFFGSKTYAWISDEFVKPYDKHKDEFSKGCSTASFKGALAAAEEYIATKDQSDSSSASSLSDGVPDKTQCYISSPMFSPLLTYNSEISRKNSEKDKCIRKSAAKANGIALKKSLKILNSQVLQKKNQTNRRSSLSQEPVKEVKRRRLSGSVATSVIHEDQTLTGSKLSRHSYPLTQKRLIEPTVQKEKLGIPLSNLKIGFLGLGNMGRRLVRNFVRSGFRVTVWNRTQEKVESFCEMCEVSVGETPADVVAASDVIFSCLSDREAVKQVVFSNTGVLRKMGEGKGYVEITSIDATTSKDIAMAIRCLGGKYLEAPILGSLEYAAASQLIVFAAGDDGLYWKCQPCFQTMGKHVFFLGEIGNAARMNLILNMVVGTTLASLAEAMALARSLDISQKDLLSILELCPLRCPLLLHRGREIVSKVPSSVPMHYVHKNLHMIMEMSNELVQPILIASAANQMYKRAEREGFGYHQMYLLYKQHHL